MQGPASSATIDEPDQNWQICRSKTGQHVRNRHWSQSSCAMARCRKGGAGGGGAGAGDGETTGVGGVRVPEGSSEGSSKGSSTRSSSGTTVTEMQ
jgi:hypothetical protein